MIFSKNAFLALIFGFFDPSSLVLAQRDDIIDPQHITQTNKFEKSSNLIGVGGEVGKHIPVRPKVTTDSDRRRLDLSTAVHYPNPCIDLPANRVPDLNENNTANNDGWTLAMGPTYGGSSSGNLPLPFTFTFLGQHYSTFNIYNKGLLVFPGLTYLYVFYANVDTRGGIDGTNDGGYVWRKAIGNNKYAVAWDNVGYYNQQTDKLNTFQVLISDGNDASMGIGNNVCYCYQDMQWMVDTTTTSGGYVGTNFGKFGIFSAPGTAYDGGYGNNDGFDFLDNKSICFKTSGLNFPPVAVNVPQNNRLDLDCGASVNNLVIFFLAPEEYKGVTLTTSGASAGLTVDIFQPSNPATATINWTPAAASTVNVTLTASDGIDNTTVTVTFTSPGPLCCQGTTAEIWNPTTNKFVRALVNGSTYCLKKYNLRAVPCQTEPVLLELWNRRTRKTLKRQKERVPPYFLWGDKMNATGYVDVKPNPRALPNGNYALRIKAIHNATNSNSSYTEIRFKNLCPKIHHHH